MVGIKVCFLMQMLCDCPVQFQHTSVGCRELTWMHSGLQDNVEVRSEITSQVLSQPELCHS